MHLRVTSLDISVLNIDENSNRKNNDFHLHLDGLSIIGRWPH